MENAISTFQTKPVNEIKLKKSVYHQPLMCWYFYKNFSFLDTPPLPSPHFFTLPDSYIYPFSRITYPKK